MSPASGRNRLLTLILLLAMAMLTACGGGAETQSQQNGGGNASSTSLINSNTPADIVAYKKYVWDNLSSQSRCGRCHAAGGQSPRFVDTSSIENAYAAALSFVNGVQVANQASPNDSLMVTIIRNGHKQVNGKSQACWLATDAQCADAIRDFIIAWNGETSGSAAVPQGVQLVAPSPLRNVGDSKTFPVSPTGFATTVHPILKAHCSACHTPTASDPHTPFFAQDDVDAAYDAVKQKIDLLTPANSRLVYRLRSQFHNCWPDTDNGETTANCVYSSQVMEDAITAFADSITPTQVDPDLIISKAMRIVPPEAIVASAGERHTANQVALWEFKTGTGSTAYDTSGVEPAMNLSMSGDYNWVGGYGVEFRNGRAQASFQASQKLRDAIRSRGEYSIEFWAVPANVTQQNKNIVTYSGSTTERNFTVSQNEYNYQFQNRSNESDLNGDALLTTNPDDEDLQSTLQHVVMTFDPVRGRRIYVNGVYTGDADPSGNNGTDGLLNNWNDNFSFMLANEIGVFDATRAWQGTLRMVAIHNRVLSDDQIMQNFKAGVGEKFFLLFSISHVPGVPPDSYIKVQAEQYDSYSYLFSNPTYVNLGNPVPAINIPIKGVRVGINGKEAVIGQAFINLSTNTITSNNQQISRLGTLVELQQGIQADDFFLSFETLGTASHTHVDPAVAVPAAPADLPAQSDIGVRTFSEINATMSGLTGVPASNSAVFAAYTKLKQQLPPTEDINSLVPANMIGITQLAFEYCDQLVENSPNIPTTCEANSSATSARECLFGSFDFSLAAATAFNSSGRTTVADALYDRMIGIPSATNATLVNAPSRTQLSDELINAPAAGNYPGNMVDRLLAAGSSTKEITKAMCASTLSSAAMLVQ